MDDNTLKFTQLERPLAFDLGAYDGKDSLFLRNKGYKVVAVEANPKRYLCKIKPLSYLCSEIASENVCISKTNGYVDFFISKSTGVWDSCNREIAERKKPSQKIAIKSITVLDLIAKYGCPQYIKCDIEGNDIDMLLSLEKSNYRPMYISCESECQGNNYDANERFAVIDQMKHLGYKKFFLVDNFKTCKNEICYAPEEISHWQTYDEVRKEMQELSQYYMEKNNSPQLWADVYCCDCN